MLDGISGLLGVADKVSGFIVMTVVLIWSVQQIYKSLREGKLTSVELAENTLRLLAEKQNELEQQNEKIDNLYAENRMLRTEIHALKIELSLLKDQLRELGERTDPPPEP